MTKQIERVESVKTPRFTVLENGVEVLKASKIELAFERVKLLQAELKPLIVLLDHKEKTSTHYSKTIHQKNYRIEAGNFDIDTAVPPVAEVPETED
ncbi:hypothetical protein QLS91_08100 [Flavobacterium sp. LB2P84]|uniref:hypothetical protein n=1 Tax=Flavobacterium yafengii TaxID=3041253 RepID=UPI0024A887A3|nr:hypothetical protein [Flavobacterium yafengii]MDI6033034.1 hypothetical protein [Flavobacterium yafengii]